MTGAPVFAVITGGGTGGHVYPALALADALVARGHERDTLFFVGARRGIEARVVPGAGYSIELLDVQGLRRGRRAVDVAANLRAGFRAARASGRALGVLGRLDPGVVVGTGGYASAPCVLAALVRRAPLVVHEQNAWPGVVNRLATRLGARAAVALPGTPLPRATITGNPVRAAIARVARRPDPARPLVAVVGGSLGSGRLNDAALGLYELWRDRVDVRVRHVAGARHEAACRARLDGLRRPTDRLEYELLGYEERMEHLYARASLAVCRAGAITVAELAAAGVPSVLVPWPGAADDHQSANARALARVGAAVVLADRD